MTARSAMPVGSGIWVMIPATCGSAWSSRSAAADVGLVGVARGARPGGPRCPPGGSRPGSCGGRPRTGRPCPTTTTAGPAHSRAPSRNAATSAATCSRMSVAIGPPRRRRGPSSEVDRRSCRVGGRAGRATRRRGRRSRVGIGQPFHGVREPSVRSKQVAACVLVADARQVDVHVRRGGRGRPRRPSGLPPRGPTTRSCCCARRAPPRARRPRGMASTVRMGESVAASAACRIAAARAARSSSVSRGSFSAAP